MDDSAKSSCFLNIYQKTKEKEKRDQSYGSLYKNKNNPLLLYTGNCTDS